MINNIALKKYCAKFLNIDNFQDYCPNGLQIQGKDNINKIIAGVSCNLELIEQAIKHNADAIFTHHGFFWKNEKPEIIGSKYKKIKLILENNINLYSYHLPLDAHLKIGNNKKLAEILDIKNAQPIEKSLVWHGEINSSIENFSALIEKKLNRKPQIFGNKKYLKTIAFCTGGAQKYIDQAIEIAADCYLSGEVSENTQAQAVENNMLYIQAGHHATERYGVQALSLHLSNKFNLEYKFIDVVNLA